LSVTHYNNELGEVVEYEMLDPQCLAEMTPLVVERAAKCERNSNELVNVDSDVLEKQSRSRMIIVTDVVVMRQQCLQLHTINHVAVGGGMYCDATACRTTHPHP